ncbi:MAG: hypothetical protein AB7S38_27800 [Vulcanimicrobiota bacterium]
MTSLAETMQFVERIVAQTEGRPTGVALEFTTEGQLSLHLCFEEADDEPAEWSRAYAEQEFEVEPPGWVKEYRQLMEQSVDPLAGLKASERTRLRAIPDPPPTEAIEPLLGQPPLYNEDAGEGLPVMALFADEKLPAEAERELERPDFRRKASAAFRCRRVGPELWEPFVIRAPQLNFYNLQGELLASRWLSLGSFDDLPQFLDRAIAWSTESAAERAERRRLAEQFKHKLQVAHEKGVDLAARALAEFAGVFYPAKLLAYSDLDDDLQAGIDRVKAYKH